MGSATHCLLLLGSPCSTGTLDTCLFMFHGFRTISRPRRPICSTHLIIALFRVFPSLDVLYCAYILYELNASVQFVESRSAGTTMQTTQWREKLNPIRYTKSAHPTLSTSTSTHTSTSHTIGGTASSTHTSNELALNVNGKQLFQNSSRSIWDYNPDELKVILFVC